MIQFKADKGIFLCHYGNVRNQNEGNVIPLWSYPTRKKDNFIITFSSCKSYPITPVLPICGRNTKSLYVSVLILIASPLAFCDLILCQHHSV